MATGVIPAGAARPDPIEPRNRPYLVAHIVNYQRAGLYVTRPASLTIGRTDVDDADLTELYATLAVETVDQGAPEPGRARADVSFTTTSKWLLSSSTGIPNREDCNLVIDQYGVDNIGKVDLRQEDAVLLRSRFLRAMEPQTGPSVVTSQQLSAGTGRRPSLRQTRPEKASSAATPPQAHCLC